MASMDVSSTQHSPAPYWHGVRRMFFLWAVIILVGFVWTYLNTAASPTIINLGWVAFSLVGLVYSKMQMPFTSSTLRNIFFVWLAVIAAGITLTQSAFFVPSLLILVPNLGVFWLLVMALGHALTGIIDGKKFYIATVGLQLLAAVAAFVMVQANPALFAVQYLIAGAVGALSMVLLIRYA